MFRQLWWQDGSATRVAVVVERLQAQRFTPMPNDQDRSIRTAPVNSCFYRPAVPWQQGCRAVERAFTGCSR